MAKNTKLALVEAKVVELESQINKLESHLLTLTAEKQEANSKAEKVTRYLKAALVFIRKEYVKTLSSEQLATKAGLLIVECLKHIEEKKSPVKCEKCEGHGVVDIRGTWMVCYDCIYGRALGHPGQKHVIDVVVAEMHREEQKNRFTSQRPQNWDVSKEAEKAKTEATKPTAADADISL